MDEKEMERFASEIFGGPIKKFPKSESDGDFDEAIRELSIKTSSNYQLFENDFRGNVNGRIYLADKEWAVVKKDEGEVFILCPWKNDFYRHMGRKVFVTEENNEPVMQRIYKEKGLGLER